MNDYPEHDKLSAVAAETQAAGEFVEWLGSQRIFLATYIEGHNFLRLRPRQPGRPARPVGRDRPGQDRGREARHAPELPGDGAMAR
jgi:hypothetical protein